MLIYDDHSGVPADEKLKRLINALLVTTLASPEDYSD